MAPVRLAWREARRSRGRSVTTIAIVALSVATMSSVRSLSSQAQIQLRGDVRQWLAADFVLELPEPPSQEQTQALADLRAETILVVEAAARITSTQAADPVSASIKAVTPGVYPFYGKIDLDPPMPLAQALGGDSAAVSPDVLDALGIPVGGAFHLGQLDFHVAAVIRNEPDRLASAPMPHPHVILSHDSLDRSHVLRATPRTLLRLLVKLPVGAEEAGARLRIQRLFPQANLIDYRAVDLRAVTAMEAAASLIAMSGWIGMALGALAAGMVAYLRVAQRLESIAVMKCLGARNRDLMAIHLVETGGIAACGAVVGVGLGVCLERVFVALAGSRLSIPLMAQFDAVNTAAIVIIAVAACLAAAAGPIAAIRRVRPVRVLRRFHEPLRASVMAPQLALSIVALAGLTAAWREASIAGALAGGLAAGALSLAPLVQWLFQAAAAAGRRLPAMAARNGLANLNRPGIRPPAMMTGLALGIMCLTACWAGRDPVDRAIADSLPVPDADLYLLWIGGAQIRDVREALGSSPDVRQPVEVLEEVALQLVRVDGAPFEEWESRLARPVPPRLIVRCRADFAGARLSNLNADALGVHPGARLEFRAGGQDVAVTVERVEPMDAFRSFRLGFQMPCGAAAAANPFYEVAVRAMPGRSDELRRALILRFRDLSVVPSSDVLSLWQEIGHRAILLLEWLSGMVIVCGSAMLALLVAVDKRRRAWEIAVWKSLGARNRVLSRVYMIEFAAAGVIAGLSGGVFGHGFASLIVSVVFRRFVPASGIGALPFAILLASFLAAVSGWAASHRLLRLKPLEILRE